MMYVVEERFVQYCECKVASMMQNGRLIRDESGQLWHSTCILSFDDLESALENQELIEVTNPLAIELELGTPQWKAIGFAMYPGVNTVERRTRKLGYIKP